MQPILRYFPQGFLLCVAMVPVGCHQPFVAGCKHGKYAFNSVKAVAVAIDLANPPKDGLFDVYDGKEIIFFASEGSYTLDLPKGLCTNGLGKKTVSGSNDAKCTTQVINARERHLYQIPYSNNATGTIGQFESRTGGCRACQSICVAPAAAGVVGVEGR